MTTTELIRDIAAVVATGGTALLLVPVPVLPPSVRRLIGLALVVAAWAVFAGTLVPSEDFSRLGDRLSSPLGALAGVVGVALVIGVAVIGTRLVLRYTTAWFVLLGLALPVRLPVPIGGQDRNLLLPLYLLIGIGVIAFLWGRLRGRFTAADEPTTVIDGPVAAFLCFSLISTVWSVNGEEAAVKAVFFYIPFLLLFLLVMVLWRHAQAIRALAGATVALSVPVAILAVEQYLTRDIFWNVRLQQANVYSRFFRANGIFFDPNILGRYLVIGMIALVALAWLRPRKRELIVCTILLVPLTAGLAVTFSRSSCLMLMVALALLAWRGFGWRRTVAVGGVTLLILASAAFAVSQNVRRTATDLDRLENVSEGRFDLIRGGVEIWQEAPVIGAGLGGFETRYEQTLTPAEQRRIRVVISHNTPVTVLSELGAFGFGLFVWLAIRVWRGGAAAARRALDPDGWIIWTLLALVTGILVHSLFYAGFFEDPFLWVLTGAMMAIAAIAAPVGREESGAAPEPEPEPVTPGG